jgi:hypothetical protein
MASQRSVHDGSVQHALRSSAARADSYQRPVRYGLGPVLAGADIAATWPCSSPVWLVAIDGDQAMRDQMLQHA